MFLNEVFVDENTSLITYYLNQNNIVVDFNDDKWWFTCLDQKN